MAKAKTPTRTKKTATLNSPGNDHEPEVTTMPARPVNVEELIRSRAYQLFEERGREPGHDFDDWLRAETEVLQQFRSKTA
ncbi:MAG: DUF2934 domain-containing protein [Terriglobales bacterium]